jgi:hypothetical protein
MPLLYWHEAQIRASIGESDAAIALMKESRQPGSDDRYGWNLYIDATIAFLRKDKDGFIEARRRLDQLKKPDNLSADAEWPPNASAVAGLWNCFDKPYKLAYGSQCRDKSKPNGPSPL